VIVDQLSLTDPNPTFVARATTLFEEAGFRVNYVPGADATVGLYRRLPRMNYDFIVLRSHSARIEVDGVSTDNVALFTGEMIDLNAYNISGVPPAAATAAARAKIEGEGSTRGASQDDSLDAQALRGVIPVYYDPANGELPFFGLRPSFIENSLDGRFDSSAVVIMMGCDGLRSDALASAFASRGVRSFVSWSEPVTARHTDAATQRLLELVLVDDVDLPEAVARVKSELGPDPVYGGELALYSP
jgi:hypothetical protein